MAAIFVTTWYLEMRARPEARRHENPHAIRIERLDPPTARAYRVLYDTVGEAWHWVDRRRIDDAELLTLIRAPHVEVWVARAGDDLVGYFELDRSAGREVKLVYFGLAPAWIGKRVGGWFLERAIERAWDGRNVELVSVHTCSLDHPRALRCYERAGFVRVDEAYHDFTP
jgi:GNAT superfamily N-acetyltransferase